MVEELKSDVKLGSNYIFDPFLGLFLGVICPKMVIFQNCRISMKFGTGNIFRAGNSNLTSNLGQIAYLTLF